MTVRCPTHDPYIAHLPRACQAPLGKKGKKVSNFKPTPGEELRLERLRRGMSQARLAKMMGIQRDTLIDWELGRVGPDFTQRCLEKMDKPTLAGMEVPK